MKLQADLRRTTSELKAAKAALSIAAGLLSAPRWAKRPEAVKLRAFRRVCEKLGVET